MMTLGGLVERQVGPVPGPRALETVFPESFFGLDRVTAFQKASESTKREILSACARHVLEESLALEEGGVAFAIRRAAEATTAEERAAYAVFAAQETRHWACVRSLFPEETEPARGPFLQLLAPIAERGSRGHSIAIIQGVLEGWGVQHYSKLARSAEGLGDFFAELARDEAAHHAAGQLLLTELSDEDVEAIAETVGTLVELVREGPQAIATILADHLAIDLETVFEQLDCVTHSQERLTVLARALRNLPRHEEILARVRTPWTPCSARECARRRLL